MTCTSWTIAAHHQTKVTSDAFTPVTFSVFFSSICEEMVEKCFLWELSCWTLGTLVDSVFTQGVSWRLFRRADELQQEKRRVHFLCNVLASMLVVGVAGPQFDHTCIVKGPLFLKGACYAASLQPWHEGDKLIAVARWNLTSVLLHCIKIHLEA